MVVMKKSELIKELAICAELTQSKAKTVLNALTDIITRELSAGENIKIDGLGRFHTVMYNSHNIKAVNGSNINLEPRLSPRFKPSEKLKKAVKSNSEPAVKAKSV